MMDARPDISPETGRSVRLLWPDRGLSPNARVHHMALASLRKQAKASAHWACKLWRLDRIPGPHDLSIVFCPPDRRRRDLDNMLAAIKPHLDGVAEYLGTDDSDWRLTISKGEPVRNGAVIVTVRAQ